MRDSFSKGSLSQMADTAGCDIDTRVWPSWGASCIEGGSLHMHPPHPACETIREAMPGPAVLVPARAHEAVSHVKSGWARTGREDVPVVRPWRAAGHDIHCSTAAGQSGFLGSLDFPGCRTRLQTVPPAKRPGQEGKAGAHAESQIPAAPL